MEGVQNRKVCRGRSAEGVQRRRECRGWRVVWFNFDYLNGHEPLREFIE